MTVYGSFHTPNTTSTLLFSCTHFNHITIYNCLNVILFQYECLSAKKLKLFLWLYIWQYHNHVFSYYQNWHTYRERKLSTYKSCPRLLLQLSLWTFMSYFYRGVTQSSLRSCICYNENYWLNDNLLLSPYMVPTIHFNKITPPLNRMSTHFSPSFFQWR
jgi:hypothetical protein